MTAQNTINTIITKMNNFADPIESLLFHDLDKFGNKDRYILLNLILLNTALKSVSPVNINQINHCTNQSSNSTLTPNEKVQCKSLMIISNISMKKLFQAWGKIKHFDVNYHKSIESMNDTNNNFNILNIPVTVLNPIRLPHSEEVFIKQMEERKIKRLIVQAAENKNEKPSNIITRIVATVDKYKGVISAGALLTFGLTALYANGYNQSTIDETSKYFYNSVNQVIKNAGNKWNDLKLLRPHCYVPGVVKDFLRNELGLKPETDQSMVTSGLPGALYNIGSSFA